MLYVLLLYTDPSHWAAAGEAAVSDVVREHRALIADLERTGRYRTSDALEFAGRTVRVRDGKTLVTDGPFVETREQLGGYYVVEARDPEEAIAIAARIPDARVGCVEVRAVKQVDP